jgi:hypothetical protein
VDNEADLEEVSEDVRSRMKFILVETVDQVLDAALLKEPGAETTAGVKAAKATKQAQRTPAPRPVSKQAKDQPAGTAL